MLALVRVDQKLIHGQISAAWVPFLQASCIVVADLELAQDHWGQSVIRLGLPPEIESVFFSEPKNLLVTLQFVASNQEVIILFRNLKAVKQAVDAGFIFSCLNLGNQFYPPSNKSYRLTDAFYIDNDDFDFLITMHKKGVDIFAQSIPRIKAVNWSNLDLKSNTVIQ